MVLTTAKEFAGLALRSKLVTKDRLNELLRTWRQESNSDAPHGFAKFLVQQDVLTKYQAKRLASGRTEGFFLGGCRILERLGKGGMGVVYLALQERLDRQVALKVLPAQLVPDGDALKRFQREARAAARLKHRNIVQVFDVDQHQGTHFIVMELVNGRNLSELLQSRGTFGLGKSVSLIRQAAEGLQHAHENGVVHRDIKPANLVLEGAILKILDLGLARVESEEKVTADHSVMGTLDYMSPEQCQDTSRVDHRSDLYSLGCTWFHLLTGKAPFADRPTTAKLLSHVTEPIPSVSELNPRIPRAVDRIIQRATAKRPEDRYVDAAALISDLATLEAELLSQTIIDTDMSAVERPTSETDTRPPALAADTTEFPETLASATQQSVDSATQIRAPQHTFLSLAYIVPVMAALVLGGVYVGIQLLKDRIPVSPDAAIVSKDVQEQVKGTEETHSLSDVRDADWSDSIGADVSQSDAFVTKDHDTPDSPSPADDSLNQMQEAMADVSATSEAPNSDAIADSALPEVTPQIPDMPENAAQELPSRDARESVVRSFSVDWPTDLVDGDILTLVSADTYELNGPIHQDDSITIQGTQANRALIVLAADDAAACWTVQNSSLTLRHVDLYVQLPDGSNYVDVFRLKTSELELIDTSVTILTDSNRTGDALSIIHLSGAREWDDKALGAAPDALNVRLLRSFVRGPGTLLRNSSTQSTLSMEQSLLTGTGPVLHAVHSVARTAKHQQMAVHINNCTLNTQQAVVMVDCRPFSLRPVPLSIDLRESLVTTMSAVSSPPPLIQWASPIDTRLIADAIGFAGEQNIYAGRSEPFVAQQASGQVATICQFNKDWQRQKLGQDLDSSNSSTQPRSLRDDWAEQMPRDFTPTAIVRGSVRQEKAGAEIRDLPIPRRLRLR